jgi:CHAD domain-containing protein
MAFRFRRKETVANAFRRITREQTAAVISLLADRGGDLKERVHDARRRIKKLRSLLHLVRSEWDPASFDKHNIGLRNAARRLSRARDAEVSLACFETVTRRLPKEECSKVHQLLLDANRHARRHGITPAQLAAIAAEVRKHGHAIAETSFEHDGWLLFAPGLARGYRRTRRMRRDVKQSPAPATLHEWRKRVKRLQFQMELLARALAKPECKIASLLKKLGTELGEHRDLHILKCTLDEYAAHGVAAAQSEPIQQAIARSSAIRLRRIQKLARSTFCGRTKAFLSAVHRAWKKWHAGNR